MTEAEARDIDVVARTPGFERASTVADTVLFEGYVLYPYRQSSGKNRVRWQFGVLAPRPWIEARGHVVDGVAGSTESWWQQTECLMEAADSAVVQVRPRFLQMQSKSVEERLPDGGCRPVHRLELGTRTEVAFDEAVPHEADVVVPLGDLLVGEKRTSFEVGGGTGSEPLYDDDGRERGRVVRRRWPLAAALVLSAERVPAPFPLVRLRARIENAADGVPTDLPRPEVLRHSLISTHSFLAVDGGRFLSQLDPPEWAAATAKECRNVRTFPVLAGATGSAELVLSAPIILYDHPQVAPESPGDLHDASEIDEILSLRTLTLTDEEKREARGTDPRVAAIVDRVDAMPPEVMERLHGAVRSLRATGSPTDAEVPALGQAQNELGGPATPWWGPGADESVDPDTDAVLVDGVPVSRGSRVRLRPRRRGTDAHDMFLAGRTARVEKVLLDVNDAQHVAVTIDDDPSAELHQWYGRFHYYGIDEIEPLGAGDVAPAAGSTADTGGDP